MSYLKFIPNALLLNCIFVFSSVFSSYAQAPRVDIKVLRQDAEQTLSEQFNRTEKALLKIQGVYFQDGLSNLNRLSVNDMASLVVVYSLPRDLMLPKNFLSDSFYCVVYGLNGLKTQGFCSFDRMKLKWYEHSIGFVFLEGEEQSEERLAQDQEWMKSIQELSQRYASARFNQATASAVIVDFAVASDFLGFLKDYNRMTHSFPPVSILLGPWVRPDDSDRAQFLGRGEQSLMISPDRYRTVSRELMQEGVRTSTMSSLPSPFGEGLKPRPFEAGVMISVKDEHFTEIQTLSLELEALGAKVVDVLLGTGTIFVRVNSAKVVEAIEKLTWISHFEVTR